MALAFASLIVVLGKNQGVPLVFLQHVTGTIDNLGPGRALGYKITRICLAPEEGFLLPAEKPAKGSFQIGMVRVKHVLAVQPMLRHVFQDQAVAQNEE